MQNHNHNHSPAGGQKQVQMRASEDALKGRYANAVQVFHGKEEFMLEFMLLDPHQGAHLLDRIILSPGHAKRLATALQDNVQKYEKHNGKIELVEVDKKEDIGFSSKVE